MAIPLRTIEEWLRFGNLSEEVNQVLESQIKIEVSNQESEQLKPEKARRTGKVSYLVKEAFPTIFSVPAQKKVGVFVLLKLWDI